MKYTAEPATLDFARRLAMHPLIFLSYSSADRENVLRFGLDLRKHSIGVWLDEWEIRVGESISKRVEEGIASCDYLAIWLTKKSVASGWVDREWRAKYLHEIRGSTKVLPLLAEDCMIPRLLRDKRYADFRGNYEQGFADLLWAVGRQPAQPETSRRAQAAAFLLGWYSTAALLPATDRSALFSNITRILASFSISTQGPISSYMSDPKLDAGTRAQESREFVARELVRVAGMQIAQYFASAGNLMLIAARGQYGLIPDDIRAKLQLEADSLTLPNSLAMVPERDAIVWLNRVARHFESCISRDV